MRALRARSIVDERTDDYWVEDALGWTRVHRRPRKALFNPKGCKDSGGPDISQITTERITEMRDPTGGTELPQDDWFDNPTRALESEWIGLTKFFRKGTGGSSGGGHAAPCPEASLPEVLREFRKHAMSKMAAPAPMGIDGLLGKDPLVLGTTTT